MSTPLFLRSSRASGRHHGRRAVALIMVLMAVALLTIVVLAFFSRAILNRQITFSSTGMAKADFMARNAQEWVIGEIRREIADGSV